MSDNKKFKYTILFVPNNNHHVRQLQLSIESIVIITVVFALFVISFTVLNTLQATQFGDLNNTINEQDAEIRQLNDENIVLRAEVEELSTALREAKVTIEANKNLQQQEALKQTEASKPSILPIAGSTALPSGYTEERGYADFVAAGGGKIVATADGVVSAVEMNNEFGYIVKVDHGNGYETAYMIKCQPQVSEKDKVMKGSTLFSLGDTGATLGYQIRFNGVAVDPMSVISVDG